MNPFATRACRSVVFLFLSLIILGLASGCAGPVHRLDDALAGPQLVVNPDTLRLGVAKVMKTDVVFSGAGFSPEEKIMVVLRGNGPATKGVVVPLGYGTADAEGRFTVSVEKKMKIYNLLKADVTFGEKGAIVLVSGPPVPAGTYTARATGYRSDRQAACALTLAPPSLFDRVKDRLARMLGKIEED